MQEAAEKPPSAQRADAAAPALLYVAGDQSGVGKSTICLAILGGCLRLGMRPSELAYIKPCTQCEDTQRVWRFCECHGIPYRGIGPIRFYQGFTSETIEEKDPEAGSRQRLERIRAAVDEISQGGKRLVIVDGVGFPSVGSVAGVSNAQVAAELRSPVLLVSRPGVGHAIDSFNFSRAYFERGFGVRVLGAVVNNVPERISYHSFDKCKLQLHRYFSRARVLGDHVSLYGVVRRDPQEWDKRKDEGTNDDQNGVACILRAPRKELEMTPEESKICDAIVQWVLSFMDLPRLLTDLGLSGYADDRASKQEALASSEEMPASPLKRKRS